MCGHIKARVPPDLSQRPSTKTRLSQHPSRRVPIHPTSRLLFRRSLTWPKLQRRRHMHSALSQRRAGLVCPARQTNAPDSSSSISRPTTIRSPVATPTSNANTTSTPESSARVTTVRSESVLIDSQDVNAPSSQFTRGTPPSRHTLCAARLSFLMK